MFEKDTLKDQAGIITGGGSGIGFAIAKYLTEHGANVTIIGRDEGKLRSAVEKLGDRAACSAGDVRNGEDVERNLADHMNRWGRIDFLVNNAAGNFLCPLEKMSENAFQSVLKIVTMGVFLWSKAVQPHMKERGYGRIVNIGTTYSWGHGALVAHSGAAKAAVLNLTKTMAIEWGPQGILTNLIAPGPVEGTEGVRRLMPDQDIQSAMARLMPVSRMAEGWEIAAATLFLISPLSAYINGVALPVDGGLSLALPGLLPVDTSMTW